MNEEHIRKLILKRLYALQESSDGGMASAEDLFSQLHVGDIGGRSALSYLEEKGYVTITRRTFGTRINSMVRITAKGVDFVEGRDSSNPINVNGDLVQVTIGDNAQNVSAGKQIGPILQGAPVLRRLHRSLGQFLVFLENNSGLPKRTTNQLSLKAQALMKALEDSDLIKRV